MSTEQNKAFMGRFHEEVFNKRNSAFGSGVTSPAYVTHDPTYHSPGDLVSGPGIPSFLLNFDTAIPDYRVTVDEQIAEGDRVVTRCTLRGTFRGEARTPWGVYKPTGRSLTFTWISIDRIVDGKVVEAWHQWDSLGLGLQLGIVSFPDKQAT